MIGPRRRGAERRGVERRIGRVEAEDGERGRAGRMPRQRGERARIDQRDGAAVVEIEHRPRVPWRLAGGDDAPIAGHAEVRVQRAPVVEAEALVLAAALDRDDAASAQRVRIRQRAARRIVQQAHALDPTTDRRCAQRADRRLDFR